ncbi:UDP-Glycosyltransferase/glycogen phosphorylase [Thozetella sp. PMI_491]|nr:UDP-Glycosyltransferase/glycogen phosphorylase [Thozetella sp. PMI_491]
MAWIRRTSVGVVVALLLALLIGQFRSEQPIEWPATSPGKNSDTILFFALAETGQINVQLATAQALLEEHPNAKIHFASFPAMRDKIAHISTAARKHNPAVNEIVFHELPGPGRIEAIGQRLNCSGSLECLAHPPGARGGRYAAKQLEYCMWSWTGEEHFAIYQKSADIITEVDAAVVVADFAFRPALEAMENLQRLSIVITPLAAADLFGMIQPMLAGFWKYPAWGTGFSFPVPWHKIPENVYLNILYLRAIFSHPNTAATVEYLKERGVNTKVVVPLRPDLFFISQTLPGASIPVDHYPAEVLLAGAIFLESAPAIEQDAELVAWIQKAPTVVVNLGSLFKYTEERAKTMAKVLQAVLQDTDVQVLWKVAKGAEFDDEYTAPVKDFLKQDRLRIMTWLSIDTLPLLQTDNTVLSVHHGGSSSYNEATAAGVPQVVIPLWEDLYNFAQLAEDLGIGLYATRDTAPEWTVAGIADPMFRILKPSEESARIRAEAKRVGEVALEKPGRYVAARAIAKKAGWT